MVVKIFLKKTVQKSQTTFKKTLKKEKVAEKNARHEEA
jgi:hypothetical protein